MIGVLRALRPRPPDVPPPGPPPFTRRVLVGLAGAAMAGLMSFLNTRLTSFALADLRGGYGYGIDESSWINTAYGIGSIVVVPFTPWLAGVFSLRRFFAVNVALLTLAGAGCAEAPGYPVLLALRFLQGVGGGALVPLLLMTVLRFSPLPQRIWGIALYACLTTLTPTVSETIAGFLTDYLTWKAVFWQNLLLGPPTIALLLIGLPVEPLKLDAFRRADYFALAFVSIALGAVTTALDQGQRLDWFSSGVIWTLFGLAAAALIAFLVNEIWMARPPLIDLGLLKRVNFAGGLLIIIVFNFSLLGASLILPQYGAEVRGWRELQVGEVLLWLAAPQLIGAPLAALLLRYLDARLILAFGLACFAAGAFMGTYVTSVWVAADLLPSQLVQACSFPFIMVPLVFIATSSLQPQDAASGGALFNVLRTLAGTFGVAIVQAVITVRERVHSATMLEHVVSAGPAATDPIFLSLGKAVPNQLVSDVAGTARVQAAVMAYADAFGMLGLIATGCLLLVLLLRETRVFYPAPKPRAVPHGNSSLPRSAAR